MMSKNFKTPQSALLICLILIVFQSPQVLSESVNELLGIEKSKTEDTEEKKPRTNQIKNTTTTKPSKNWAKNSGQEGIVNKQIDMNFVSLLIANMNVKEALKVLNTPELFKQVIENETKKKSAVAAAKANNLDQDRNVEFLMRRGAENILLDTYFNRLIMNKLPKDFPSNQQISEYYNSNKAQFVVPERLHVWQIFLKKIEDDKLAVKLKKRVDKIIIDLKTGKADFSNVAITQSEHAESKSVGGYMGLLKTIDLLPAMRESILKLKIGEISEPVESGAGIHILKRGKILKEEVLKLNQVEPQIRRLLVNQANSQLRNAIFTQAGKEFPQKITDEELEKWRLHLKANLN